MPLSFHPKQGTVLVCDFRGYIVPEMVKKRPVVVISGRLKNRSHLVTVIPLSLTAPKFDVPYVVKLSRSYKPDDEPNVPCWAKCDLIANVSFERLDRFKTGRRKWFAPQMAEQDLQAVKVGALYGLGMESLLLDGKFPN